MRPSGSNAFCGTIPPPASCAMPTPATRSRSSAPKSTSSTCRGLFLLPFDADQIVDDGRGVLFGDRGLIGLDHLFDDLVPMLAIHRRLVHHMVGRMAGQTIARDRFLAGTGGEGDRGIVRHVEIDLL